jgi:hypothetical protein
MAIIDAPVRLPAGGGNPAPSRFVGGTICTITFKERSMAFDFVRENTVSRKRLETLVRGLTDADLACTTSFGWTVSALLAHLAYWDQRVVALLRRWKERGVDDSPVDADAVNEALKPLCFAMDPHTAVELCLASAREADAELETLSPSLVDAIQASPTHFRFNRGLHRNDHLDQIEQALGRARDERGAA